MLAHVEAHEALIAGVLGLAALYAWQRRRDPIDRWFAIATLFICLTGSIGMILAQYDDPWRYIRLALRLAGPPAMLVILEEAVRSASNPGSRRTSLGFAGFLWALAVGVLIYYGGGTIVELQLPFLEEAQFGVTAWMAMLAVCTLAGLLTVLPAAFRRDSPGFAGIAAMFLLLSEAWAAVDPRWGSGAVGIGINLSYRSLLTFALAAVGLYKAQAAGAGWLMSSVSKLEADTKKPSAKPAKLSAKPAVVETKDEPDEEAGAPEEPVGEERPSTAPRKSKGPKSGKKRKSKS
jgi:hypothetical protein